MSPNGYIFLKLCQLKDVREGGILVFFPLCSGSGGDEDLKNIWIICPSAYIHTYVCPSPGRPGPLQGSLENSSGHSGRTSGWTELYGWTKSPFILHDFLPFGSFRGHCPADTTATIMKYWSRSRAPMTVFSLWATCFYMLSIILAVAAYLH